MYKPSIPQFAAVLELFARFHPARLGVLLGQASPPSTFEVAELLQGFSEMSDLGVRISGGRSIPEAERVLCLTERITDMIDAIGGWEHIHKMTAEVKRDVPDSWWREAHDYVTYISPGGQIHDGMGGMGRKIFGIDGKLGVNSRTVRRRFRKLLRIIAMHTLSITPDGDADLAREAPSVRTPS